MAYRDYIIDGFLFLTLSLLIIPYFSSWELIIPELITTFPIYHSLRSLQYKISIYCSMVVSIPMILELFVRVVLEPRLLTDFKTFISNFLLFLTLLLPDLIMILFVIPFLDLKLFNLAFEGRFVVSIWSLAKFLYKYGDNCFFQDKVSLVIFFLLCSNRTLVYYSYYFSFSGLAIWVTEVTMFLGFFLYGIKIITWFLYLKKIPKECSLTTDQYLCNIYIISASFVFISILILYLAFNPSMNWLQTDANYLSGSTYLFSLFYVQITVFQGRALQREAVAVKSTLAVKRMFLRYMSHEIRTPLNTVMLGLQYLQEDMIKNEDSAERLGVLYDIKQSCEVATKTLNDMLLYDKIETGALKLDRTEVKILDFIKTTLQPYYIQALQEGISLSIHYVHGENKDRELDINGSEFEKLQSMTANIDSNKLAQVIRNLLGNALKFTPREGDVTIKLYKSIMQNQHQLQSEKSGRLITPLTDFISMDIIDTGPGISMENQAQLFQGVIQFSPGEMQEGGGSGLGLYISKGLMDAHDGLLMVSSKGLGHGSTFTIQLPVVVPVCVTDLELVTDQTNTRRPLNSMAFEDSEIISTSTSNRQRIPTVSGRYLTNYEDNSSLRTVQESNVGIFHRPRLSLSRQIRSDERVDTENLDHGGIEEAVEAETRAEKSISMKANSTTSLSTPSSLRYPRPKYSKVLVVDDVAMNRKMLIRLLKDRFTSHCEACHGLEAIDKVRDSMITGMTFDVITMDYQMPVMDGPTAVKAIRELGYTGTILGVTGNALPEDIRTFISHGVNEVLTKPVDMITFDNVLLKYCGRSDAFT